MDRDDILAQVRLLTLIDSTNVSDADIVTIINNGMQEISVMSDWAWLEETATASLTDSQQTVALPNDFDRLIALVDVDNDEALTYMSPPRFFKLYGGDTNESTNPEVFTIFEGAIHLYPTPKADDTDRLLLYYYEDVTTLSSGGDTPAFHAAFHPMLVEYCKWKLYEREEYYDQSERAFITFSRYLNNMVEWYARRYKRNPYIAGDGDRHGRVVDPNLRWVYQV